MAVMYHTFIECHIGDHYDDDYRFCNLCIEHNIENICSSFIVCEHSLDCTTCFKLMKIQNYKLLRSNYELRKRCFADPMIPYDEDYFEVYMTWKLFKEKFLPSYFNIDICCCLKGNIIKFIL